MTALDSRPLEAAKPWPLFGYAPGNYVCLCSTCSKQFEGDKRAVMCLDCAASRANALRASLPPAPAGSVGEAIEMLRFNAQHLVAEDDKEDALRTLAVAKDVMRDVADALAAVPVLPVEPVAWRYRLFMELGQVETRLSADRLEAPFGRRGRDYDPSYTFDETPLYASPSPLPAQEDGWQPIETAPKDGTRILATCADAQVPRASITWWDGTWLIQIVPAEFLTGDPRQWFPTHWQPLPAPPQPQETKP